MGGDEGGDGGEKVRSIGSSLFVMTTSSTQIVLPSLEISKVMLSTLAATPGSSLTTTAAGGRGDDGLGFGPISTELSSSLLFKFIIYSNFSNIKEFSLFLG